MADIQSAVESIRRLANTYRDMVTAADALESIGSVQQATREAMAARVAAEDARDKALLELSAAQSELEALRKDAESVADAANVRVADIKSSALNEANRIVEAAKASASEYSKAALEKAEKELAAVHADTAAAQAALASVQAKKAEADKEAEAADAKLTKLQAAFDALKAKIGA